MESEFSFWANPLSSAASFRIFHLRNGVKLKRRSPDAFYNEALKQHSSLEVRRSTVAEATHNHRKFIICLVVAASLTGSNVGSQYCATTRLPFLATLNLPDLTKLTNDPVKHYSHWPPIPTKLPSDIPKIEVKPGEYPSNHVLTFHIWCSSNPLTVDSVRLRLFQRTLTGVAAKWYIELQ